MVINLDSKKMILTIAAALACFAAFAVIAFEDSSDAATKTYEMYVEVVDESGTVSDVHYVYFESEVDNAKYAEAATKALSDAGLGLMTVTFNSEKNRINIKYDESGNNACYYSDGTDWVQVATSETDYINNAKLGFAVGNGYIPEETYEELSEYEQGYWYETGWGGNYAYMKILETPGTFDKILDYTVNMTIIDDNLTKTTKQTFKFKSDNEPTAWCATIIAAIPENSVFAPFDAIFGGTYISIAFDGSFNNATYYKDGGKWVAVTDSATQYTSGAELDFELKNGYISTEKYNGLSSSEQKCWEETGMGFGYDYMRIAGATPSSGDNTLLYVGIAIAVIIIIIVAVVFIKKKNA